MTVYLTHRYRWPRTLGELLQLLQLLPRSYFTDSIR